jgi:hypothetical protein
VLMTAIAVLTVARLLATPAALSPSARSAPS